ncbi:MAG: aminotransferase class III-fold pyridoxal phosphate-dependent enzyme [Deltaproteobacteria bacterium]|nr:aminotransferase class III-fold pyridoxal phosphate-dependent enzyme [Deltaproteobacteria bacterium]
MLKNEKNKELTEKFNKYYPGGHTNFRIPLKATKGRVFIVRAEGSHMWDVDGNEYIDYQGALGPSILGHRHPEYTQALKDLLDTTSICIGSGAVFSPDDVEVAERFVKYVPCAEEIKLSITGTEAVQMAIRLARAYTGRPYFIRFGGHYHGWVDNILGGLPNTNPEGKPFAVQDPTSSPWEDWAFTTGKAPSANQESFLLPWNDLDALETTLKKYGEEIALIHFEALVCNHFCQLPRPGYLERIRELCTEYGIVMSIDEVITGFRLGLSGAQGHFGVTPDIATFGKAMSAGMPSSAVVGKAEIMELLRETGENKVLGPGTFNGYPLGTRATLANMKILEKDDGAVYTEMNRVQKRLMDGLEESAERHGIPMCIQGDTGVFFTIFGVEKGTVVYTDEDMADLDIPMLLKFWEAMKQEGFAILTGGRWYMTIVHTDEDIDRTLESADKVMATL